MRRSLQQALRSEQPTLVEFYAHWCEPCKDMLPVLRKLEKDMEGQCQIVTIDIDKNVLLKQQYKVEAVPTFIIFKNGQPRWRQVGKQAYDTLKKALHGAR